MAIPLIAGLISSVGPAIVKGAKKLFQKAASKGVDKLMDTAGTALGNKLSGALNPKEAALARGDVMTNVQQQMLDFNANEAQKNRDFQQSMFNQQTQLANTEMQRKVADYQAAGLNPAALMGAGSAAGASLPSAGSGDSAAAPSVGGVANLSDLFQMQKLDAELDYMGAQTAKIKAETRGQEIDNANKPEYWNKQLELMGANIGEAEANIDNLLQQVKTGAADEALKRANERLTGVKISQASLENAILAYKVGMTAVDAQYYEAMKSFDLALKSATLDKTEEEIKNLRKARALMQAQIITEGAKSKMFSSQANATDEFARMTRKKTTWIDAGEIEKIRNLSKNSDLIDYLARKYDAEANYTDMKPLLEMIDVLGDIVSE